MAISSLTNFLNSVSLEKEDNNAKKTWAIHLDVAGTVENSREDELGLLREDHDPVSLCPAFFALCTFAVLPLLLDLNGSFHSGAYLFLRATRCWFLIWGVASAAGDLACLAMTHEATTGVRWASGRALGTDSPSSGQPCQVVATAVP